MNVAIIKYNAGNIQSVLYSLERIAVSATVTDDPEEILKADKVIFPGVGEARTAMRHLKERNLDHLIKSIKQPVLGICLGMQLLCSHSEENDTPCLGIFDLQVKKFGIGAYRLKIPQIGWNTIMNLSGPIFSNLSGNQYCYFVHSYYAEIGPQTAAVTEYGVSFSSALQFANFYGVQFHPEKSASTGEKILSNFLSI